MFIATAVLVAVTSLVAGLQSDLQHYLTARAKIEHISAISLSVYVPGQSSNINVTAGSMKYGEADPAITPETIFQIGSNTKSFTSAALLQLEAEGVLSIEDTVGKWLPQYPAWKNVTIHRLLDMTSDIPTYDDMESMLSAYANDPAKDWSTKELVGMVYPRIDANAGWLYSNTAYLMSEMIVERASHHSYTEEIRRRFLSNPRIGLTSTYYQPSIYPSAVSNRMVSGYFYSTDADNNGLQPLYGKDMRDLSLSWAQGAGGIVSTPEDVTRWCRALYGGIVLKPKQQRELETLVSQDTAKPIAQTDAAHPRAFGLGVAQLTMPKLGRFWFYEGMTLGYRVAYAYFPKTRAVFAIGLNSQPNKKDDKIGPLMSEIFTRLHAAGKY
ncbi:MAG TPA: serine hydrolase domain-containing protein [Candidatus Baltobacteraceae bacterium]|nr:serine hydrolase domain-containing protein [Candidatus Baltobacteraceae bacterium]